MFCWPRAKMATQASLYMYSYHSYRESQCSIDCYEKWWSIIPPISIKPTIIYHHKFLNTNTTITYTYENPCPSLRQAHNYGGVKLVNAILTLSSWIIGSQTAIQIHVWTKSKFCVYSLTSTWEMSGLYFGREHIYKLYIMLFKMCSWDGPTDGWFDYHSKRGRKWS